jgi:phosphonate transport system substrate-binding protein
MRYRITSVVAAIVLLSALGRIGAGADPAKEAPGKPARPLRLGGVAYSPDAVTVWRGIRVYFARQGMPIDFVLYSDYDSLIQALRDGQVDIAWNSPLAHARFHLLSGGQSQTLVMRDVDRGYRSKLIVHKDAGIATLADLAGKTLVLGSRDSAEATVLPTYFLKKEGVDFGKLKVLSLHQEVDERGSPCCSENHILQALQKGRGHAGIVSEFLWKRLSADRPAELSQFKDIWTSPSFSHCVFTARQDFNKDQAARFTQLMLAMDGKDPVTAEVLRLEQAQKWVPGTHEGYDDLLQALRAEKGAPEKAPDNKQGSDKSEGKTPDSKQVNDKIKEIAGRAEVLKAVRKYFATLKAVDPARQRVTLLLEGETLPKVWDLTPDAEIKRAGWWARLDQLTLGDRVWVWFKINRNQEPLAVLMLADELSEQDIHGSGVTLEARDAKSMTLKPVKGATRTLQTQGIEAVRGKDGSALDGFTAGEHVFVQSAGDKGRLILDGAAFEARRAEQKAALRQRWGAEGLPGTVIFLHLSGEMEFMLDHEAIRWGRSLKPGDKVKLQTTPPVPAVVKLVRPWRERTQLRLVVAGADVAELTLGQRCSLLMDVPPPEVDTALLPPDLDRPRSRDERVEWFLSSIYCTCAVKGDVCTGHFYTLASCNPNGCAAPNAMRKELAAHIDQGLNDKEIFEALIKVHGPELLRPHLLP